MRKFAVVLMAALLSSVAVPVFAGTAQEKETCAISANTCLNRAEVLEKRIGRLKAQIMKGESKYSMEELKMLEQKLQDAMDQLDKVEGGK